MSICDKDGRKIKPKGTGHKINCDQVAWLLDIAERYISRDLRPAISRQRTMKKYAMLYEIMEIANLDFEDDKARYNATPFDVRKEQHNDTND